MGENEKFCVFCGVPNQKVILFTLRTLMKCEYILECRKNHQLKYNDVVLPQFANGIDGYHRTCHKNFLAVQQKYKDDGPFMPSDYDKREEETQELLVPACLGSANIKVEKIELVETNEACISSYQNDEQNIVDPLIKFEDEASCSTTNIAPEPLHLLPETSENPPIQQINIAKPLELLPETSGRPGRPRREQISMKLRKKSTDTVYCRLCLKQTNNKATRLPLGDLDLNYPNETKTFKENKRKKIEEVQMMMNLCLPFYEALTFNPVLCFNCLTRLKSCYEFVDQCKQNQKLIENYVESFGNTEMIANINDIANSEFSLKKKLIPKKTEVANTPTPLLKTIIPSKTYQSVSEKRSTPNIAEPTVAKRRKTDQTENQKSKEFESNAVINVKEEFSVEDDTFEENNTRPPIKVELDYTDCPSLVKIEPEENIEILEINRISLNVDEISKNRESVDSESDRISQQEHQRKIFSSKAKPSVLECNDLFCTADANCICLKCTK